MKALSFALLSAVILVVGTPAQAGSEFIPIQERAQGQALGGGNLLNDSLYTNPAASAFVKVYAVEGTYLLPKNFAVSILDTKTSDVGGGLGYFRQKVEGQETMYQGAKLAILGKLTENIGFGIAGKALWGPNFLTGEATSTKDVDVGMLFNIHPLQLGITGKNLAGGEAAFNLERELVVGGRLGYDDLLFLSVAAHSRMSQVEKPYQLGIGAEYVSPHFFALKGGYRIDFEKSMGFWSAGASFLAPKIAVHYAAEFPAEPSESIEHTVAASLLF